MESGYEEIEVTGVVGVTAKQAIQTLHNQSMSAPYIVPYNPFVVSVNGFISPTLVVITLVANCAVCAVLLRPHMVSPTNILLVAIATSDMLTGIWSVPGYVYFYALGGYRDWVPYSWCFAYNSLTEFIPSAFHTASIWLTVALAVQRYIYVCHALTARQICTIAIFVRVIVVIFVVAILSQLCRFFESNYIEITVQSLLDPNKIYFNVYYWFRVIFIHLVPCSALVILTALLVNAMRRAQRRRQLLLKQNRRSESRRLAESNWTTLMLVAVVGVFLVVEFPLAILLILLIINNTFDMDIVERRSYEIATVFVNMIIQLSYPFNFVIYCTMSRQFRSTFRAMFCPGSVANAAVAETDGDATVHQGRNHEPTYVTLADDGGCSKGQQLQQQDETQPLTCDLTNETQL